MAIVPSSINSGETFGTPSVIHHYVGSGSITVTGSHTLREYLEYIGSGTITIGSDSSTVIRIKYTGNGGFVLSGTTPISIENFFNLSSRWNVFNDLLFDREFEWNVGEIPLSWYTVIFQCPQNQGVDPDDPTECITNGVLLPDCACDPEDVSYTQIIAARGLRDLCTKLKQGTLVPTLNCRIVSVQRSTNPVYNTDQSLDETACNTVISEEPCVVPECVNFCVDDFVVFSGSLEFKVIEQLHYVGSGSINLSSSTTVDAFRYRGGGSLLLGSSAKFKSSSFQYSGSGNITLSANTDVNYPKYRYVGGGNISLAGNSGYKNSYLGNFEIIGFMDMQLDSVASSFSQTTDQDDLSFTTEVVDTDCGCSDVPLTIGLTQNIDTSNDLHSFLVRNNVQINNPINLRYRAIDNTWQSNFHFIGLSADGVTNEKWSFISNWTCTNDLGGEVTGYNFWKFSIYIKKYNLTSGEDFDTRIVYSFPADLVCLNNELDFSFTINVLTNEVIVNGDVYSDLGIIFDDLKLFNNEFWKANPNLNININKFIINQSEAVFDISPIFSS